MIQSIVLFFLVVACVEFFAYFGLISKLNVLSGLFKKILPAIFSKNISEHWKEIFVPAIACKLMVFCLKIFVILSFSLTSFLLIAHTVYSVWELIFSPIGLLLTLCFSSAWIITRNKLLKR